MSSFNIELPTLGSFSHLIFSEKQVYPCSAEEAVSRKGGQAYPVREGTLGLSPRSHVLARVGPCPGLCPYITENVLCL